MSHTVVFPGLGLSFDLNPIPFTIFGWPIHWYGIIIATGFLLAVGYCLRIRTRFGIREDDLLDMLLFAAPSAFWGRGSTTSSSIWTSSAGQTALWTLPRWSGSGTAASPFTAASLPQP